MINCKILSENKSIHKVSKMLWYIKCRDCGDWFRFKPGSKQGSFPVRCEFHHRAFKHNFYIKAKKDKIVVKRIFNTQFEDL